MKLDDGSDRIAQRRLAPVLLRKPPSVEVGIDGHVVPESLRSGQQGVQLDLLDRWLRPGAGARSRDRCEQLIVTERGKLAAERRHLPEHRQLAGIGHRRQVVVQLGDDRLDRIPVLRQRQSGKNLREVGVRSGADKQAPREVAILARILPKPGSSSSTRAERLLSEVSRLHEPRDPLHSQRTTRSTRSPPVPRSSSHSWRLHASSEP